MGNINTAEYWDQVYWAEGGNTWRRYPGCYSRIIDRIGPGQQVLDVGGGVGILCRLLQKSGCYPFLIDISPVAIQIAAAVYGVPGTVMKVPPMTAILTYDWIVATEFLEHLTDPGAFLAEAVKHAPKAIYSVPNNRLGPEDEPEHQQKFTEKKLRSLLKDYYSEVEIESFRELFPTGRVVQQGNTLKAEGIDMPTLIAYCEV